MLGTSSSRDRAEGSITYIAVYWRDGEAEDDKCGSFATCHIVLIVVISLVVPRMPG